MHACMIRGSAPRGRGPIVLLTSSAVEQPSAAQAIDVLLAFETAPGSQTGSGYEQLGSVPVTGSEVRS